MTVTELADRLRADLGVTNGRSKIPGGVVGTIARYAEIYDLGWPHSVTTACLGIDHAVTTGRLDHTLVDQLHAMSAYRLIGVIADIATDCACIADVSGYLIRRYARP